MSGAKKPKPADATLALGHHEIHVWHAHLDLAHEPRAEFTRLLSSEERAGGALSCSARAAAFREWPQHLADFDRGLSGLRAGGGEVLVFSGG